MWRKHEIRGEANDRASTAIVQGPTSQTLLSKIAKAVVNDPAVVAPIEQFWVEAVKS